ncbi:DUF6443 domain-containing protein [Pedobacter cryoconitis]|uniref:RHS repeat-associated protein n=1 Tax=Pedobacter cryoconitis TaxID=188932 RepID=A0A7X0J3I0_9SPHI|nr:DUF6443 domain-containing protein [Pedobacter cryoconitis]MBB6499989.1 RHS repeat-associated protein [Pedobacter cryoconitis]
MEKESGQSFSYFKYILAWVIALNWFNANAQQKDIVLNKYSNQTEITASGSVTLNPGFEIPEGNNVWIYTAVNFLNCTPFAGGNPGLYQNYVSTRVFKIPGVFTETDVNAGGRSTCEVNQTIQYYDGLGQPLQTVTVQGSPTFRDVVQPVVYDPFGRESKKYLPYVATSANSNGAYKQTALTDQNSFYSNPSGWSAPNVTVMPNVAFSETKFEDSPLNRVLEQGAPGVSWQLSNGHTSKMDYGTNAASDVKLWTVTSNGATAGYYPAGSLNRTTSKDENWVITDGKGGTTDEYKDFDGNVVLRRVWENDTKSLSTYYVYDDYNNLRYVLPPAVNENGQNLTSFTESDPLFDQFIYGYHYDGRRRAIEKKIPGKGWDYIIYNQLDQVVLTQDGNQRANNQWLFTKYDALGRVIITGLYTDASSRAAIQSTVDVQPGINLPLWEQTDNANSNGLGIGYTNLSFPTAGIAYYHGINFYDDYDFYNNTFGQPSSSQVAGERTKGQLTGTRVTVLGTSTMLLTTRYYDEEGRVIQTKAENHLGGSDIVDNIYDFAGELTASTRTHSANGATTVIATRQAYDHMGRKKATMESINGATEVVLNKLDYNEIGQLIKKSVHSTDGATTFLQNSNYAYNERGWLKGNTSDQFSYKLGYDTLSTPQYNGNIASQNWGTGNQFVYSYDKLNRLISGTSTGVTMSEVQSYDLMGNISSLSRDGGAAGVYSYTGNRLTSITGGPLTTGTYSYDANGNTTTDGRNGVTFTYNVLNLPLTVTKAGLNLAYLYDASGNKLKKTSNGTSRDYIGGIEYNGTAIDLIHNEEGIARKIGTDYSYEYNLSDNLGNIRYTFHVNPVTGQLERLQSDDYYPFGLRKSSGSPVSLNNKYLYNGKELQDELGQYDYGARFYDPVIGRWGVVDAKAEFGKRFSPYNYAENNPIRNIDPDGNFCIPCLIEIGVAIYEAATAAEVVTVGLAATTTVIAVKGINSYSRNRNYSVQDGTMVSMKAHSEPVKLGDTPENPQPTSRAARRDAMRKGGLPTSQPLHEDKDSNSKDKVYLDRDGENTVQDAKNDESHPGQPHWEAGKTKKDESKPDGLNRSGQKSNKPQMQNGNKGKSYYNPDAPKPQFSFNNIIS